jgi:long-subunit fatty acid transport protein
MTGKETILMFQHFRRAVLFCITCFLVTHSVFGGGQSVFSFIRNDASARFAGIGGSAVAMRHDPALIFYNPAGLYGMQNPQVSASYFRHIVDINTGFVSYAQEFKRYGWFGAGIAYVNYGTQRHVDHLENVLGDFTSSDLAFIVTYSNSVFDENFSFGLSTKFFYSSLTPEHLSTGFAVDLGIQYYVPQQDLTLGASLLNLGRQITPYEETRESLPLDLKVGVSKGLEHLPLVLSVNFHHLSEDTGETFDRFRGFTIGGEFTVTDAVRLRFGYRNEMRQDLKIGSAIGLAGFAAGFGVHVQSYMFDYGFTSLGKIGSMHHVTLRYGFR